MSILDKLVGNSYARVLKQLQRSVDAINGMSEDLKKLKDADFPKRTEALKAKLAEANGDYEKEQEILNEMLPEAFGLVREASRRLFGESHFDVQLVGGIVLHRGQIAEMKTGEGKTLVATLPLFLNALTGRGVHLITVNDYLSKFNGEGMGDIYHFLGLSTAVIQSNQTTYKFNKTKSYKHYSECDGSNLVPCSRQEAYACDITYGTNNEFGFDYLRDNMAPSVEACVMKELHYAIVDEVDSILIDEARTPLIISAAAEESASLYQQFAGLVPKLKPEVDYLIDEKDRAVTLTPEGLERMEKMLGLGNIYEKDSISLVHHLEQALKAHALFKRDKDYVVKDGEIIIVDEFTGRLMVGRRYNEGLHQAIEAKEGVEVKRESQTLATISFQNLFRIYKKLAGMTGTAATEAEEFFKIYKLDVVEIPTNKTVVRIDHSDKIYKTVEAKYNAVVEDIRERNSQGQPVLVGTVSVENNELMSKLLKKAGIKHEILNAKHHDREAKIIARAGERGAVTVATNMAGRGTDIKLTPESRKAGGLHVVGTERHEARRIDNQLRGRSGRQGDPGSSQFYVSLDDDLMRIFGGERIKTLMDRMGLADDMPIENKMISKSIESAQRRVEGHNFDIRKHLVEYDDVMNKHREIIYKKRRAILEAGTVFEKAPEASEVEITSFENYDPDEHKPGGPLNLKEDILGILEDEFARITNTYVGDNEAIERETRLILGGVKIEKFDPESLFEIAKSIYEDKEKRFGLEVMRSVEKMVYLRTIDMLWVEHLTTMEELRESIGLRGYGQRDPLVEYKQEAYTLFNQLLGAIESSVAKNILRVEIQLAPTAPVKRQPLEYQAPDSDTVGDNDLAEMEEAANVVDGELVDETKLAEEIAEPKAEKSEKHDLGVTTTIKSPAGKTVFERMAASAGKQGTVEHKGGKVGRNDPCPCGAKNPDGSPKKYKKCCGR